MAVMDFKAHRGNAARNNIGNKHIDDDSDAPIETPPSRHEALQVKITIGTIDELYALKLGSILTDFACSTWLIETQKMKVSLLTDYFARK